MWQIIESGDNSNLNDIIGLERAEIAEGQRARLDITAAVPVPTWQIDDLRDSLNAVGVEDLQINGGNGIFINITWRKGFPWAAIIILALVAVIAVAAWQMFRDVPAPVSTLVWVAGALLAGAVAYNLLRRQT